MTRLTHMALVAGTILTATVLTLFASTNPTFAADPTYTVKDGDSLFGIAASLGYTGQEQVFTDLVVKMNSLGGPDQLAVGQVLRLPTPGASASNTSAGTTSSTPQSGTASVSQTTTTTSASTYTVKDGDTLFGIASRIGVAAGGEQAFTDAVVKLNSLSGPDQLSVGQVLKLPGGTTQTSQTTTSTQPSASQQISNSQAATNSQPAASQTVNAQTYGTTPQQSVETLRASTLGTCADSGAPTCDYSSNDQLIIPSLSHGDSTRCGSTTLKSKVNVYDVRGDGAMGIPIADCDVVRENFAIFPGYGGYPGSGGTTVLAGHVDYHPHYMAVFWYLRDIKPGAEIQYLNKDGKTIKYKVDWAQAITDPNFDWSSLAKAGSQEALVLITCDGVFNPDTHEYDHRFVTHAVISQ